MGKGSFDDLLGQFDDFSSGFGDLLGGAKGAQKDAQKPAPKKAEKGLPWAAKTIDGEYYVPLSQVVELLEQNDVLPAVRKGLQARVDAKRAESS